MPWSFGLRAPEVASYLFPVSVVDHTLFVLWVRLAPTEPAGPWATAALAPIKAVVGLPTLFALPGVIPVSSTEYVSFVCARPH